MILLHIFTTKQNAEVQQKLLKKYKLEETTKTHATQNEEGKNIKSTLSEHLLRYLVNASCIYPLFYIKSF